jgi:hypothetical protein
MASMMVLASWTLGYAGLIFVMWWAMIPAMMLPSAAPILLLFARVNCDEKAGGRPFIPAMGTPDDALRVVESYWAKTGGFGCILMSRMIGRIWETTKRSCELFARCVLPL